GSPGAGAPCGSPATGTGRWRPACAWPWAVVAAAAAATTRCRPRAALPPPAVTPRRCAPTTRPSARAVRRTTWRWSTTRCWPAPRTAGSAPATACAGSPATATARPTRREGITRLRGLASRDDVGGPARSAWRQALLWLNATRADAALYDEFLKIQPNDREVAAKRAQLRDQATGGAAQQDPNQRLLAEGFRALEGGDDAVAEARFAQVLRARPRDPEAMGGLGSVRLRQQRFAEASELLRPAAAANRKWKQAADTAQYWVTLQGARNGGPDAVRKVSAAVQLVPREPAGHVLLAQLQEGSDPAAAEAGYRKALELDPANAGALQGLVGLLGRQGRAAEAASLYERLTPEQRERAG